MKTWYLFGGGSRVAKRALVVLGCSICLFSSLLLAQTASPTVPMQIVEQHRVYVGSHSIIYNRVAPPVFPVPAVQVRPAATPSPQYLAWVQARELKAYKFLMLGATVYDHQFTVLRWSNGDQWVRAISNVDFNYFCGLMEFETADTIYDYFMMASNETTDSSDGQTLTWLAQARQQLPSSVTGYIILEGNAANNPEALADLDAIHTYFSSNKEKIISDYQQRTAAWAKQERWNKSHPPVQHDTVINLWPVKSSVYLKGANQ